MPLLGSAAKRLRLLHLGSDEWYFDQIREEYLKRSYQPEYIGDYNLKILRGYAEADFEYLGQRLPGAPDFKEKAFYIPPRLQYQPYWLDINPRVASFSTFRLYHWLKNCQHSDTQVNPNSIHWREIIETQELEEESYRVLAPFRKPDQPAKLSHETQAELDFQFILNIPGDLISDIHLDYHLVEHLNYSIEDHRPIPTFPGGIKIDIPTLQWYLSCKIQEWVAFGGERALEQGQFLSGIHRHKQFKREFYWDLWEDLENLRAEAVAVTIVTCALQKIWRKHQTTLREQNLWD